MLIVLFVTFFNSGTPPPKLPEDDPLDAEEHLRQSQESKVKAGEKASEAVTMLEENVQKIVQEKRTEGQRTRVPTAVYNVECPWDLTGFN